MGAVTADLKAELASLERPTGISASFGADVEEQAKTFRDLTTLQKMIAYNQNRIFEGITRNIFILGLVSLFTDLSSQMVFPLIPPFLTTVLGCGAYSVRIVEGVAETTASLLKVVSGYWSDKIRRRKPFVLFGYGMSSITKPLFALADVWTFVLFLRVIERIGKGLRTAPRDALVAESCDERVRGFIGLPPALVQL